MRLVYAAVAALALFAVPSIVRAEEAPKPAVEKTVKGKKAKKSKKGETKTEAPKAEAPKAETK